MGHHHPARGRAASEANAGDPWRHHPQHPTLLPGRWPPPSLEGRGSSQPLQGLLSAALLRDGRVGGRGELVVCGTTPTSRGEAPPGTGGAGHSLAGTPGPAAGSHVVPRPSSHGSACPQAWSRRTSPSMLAGSAPLARIAPTHAAAPRPKDAETATPAPRPRSQRWSRDPPRSPSPAPRCRSGRRPLLSQRQTEPCGNHPRELTAPPKSRAPGSCSLPFRALLKV